MKLATFQRCCQLLSSTLDGFEPQYLLEFVNGSAGWVTDAEKWQLMKDGIFFIDTTNYRDLGTHRGQRIQKSQFPKEVFQKDKITPLLNKLNKTILQTHLEHLTSFRNRCTILTTISSTGAHQHGITAIPFHHPWSRQHSIIVTISSQSSKTIVVGAHKDSVNHESRMKGRAPGVVLRVLLSDEDLVQGKAENTVGFHWYALEYKRRGRDVRGMLQQDMTGFYNETIEKQREFGLMMDIVSVDAPLMEYVKIIIEEYTHLPGTETGCGPHCGSDHMSSIEAGYPRAFVIKDAFEHTDNHLHGIDDLIEYLDYDHIIDHARMMLGFLYELAFAKP
ncbi:Zn-dependent exopeptidase [Acephala macrosclerotiorum]|nr:Zn-dependent exopeptidase [Acephala macrosclerotiorum]